MSEQEDQSQSSASALLVAARESLGYSQEEVADKLYLTTTFIRHIDAGEFDKIPKQAFVKGYLRTYARTVNLSGDEIVALYEAELEAHDPEPEIKGVTEEDVSSSAITGPVLQTGLIGLGGLILVVALVWWLVSEPDSPMPQVSQPAVQMPSPEEEAAEVFDFVQAESEVATLRTTEAALSDDASLEAPVVEDDLGQTLQTSLEPADTSSSESTADEPLLVPAEVVTAETEVEGTSTSNAPADDIRIERTNGGDRSFITVDAGGFDQVELSFTDECWVEVEDAARGLIYNDLNREGDVLTLYATAPFEILLGKATGVEMIYNGRPFDIGPYISPDKTAKLTVSE